MRGLLATLVLPLARALGTAGPLPARFRPEIAPASARPGRSWPMLSRRLRAPWAALGGASLVLAALPACTPGAYPFDPLREMHYQQSQRLLEPDRLLPPSGSAPRTGARVPVTFAEAGALQNPVRRTPETAQAAAETFRVNCAQCHGQDGRARTFVADRFNQLGFVPPADLTTSRVRGRTDGEIYWIIVNGLGNMPSFDKLLTDEQVWGLVNHVRQLQGQ